MNAQDIKRLRNELKVTQQALADFLGVHVTTITRWERGQMIPDHIAQMALSMAAFLQDQGLLARFIQENSH